MSAPSGEPSMQQEAAEIHCRVMSRVMRSAGVKEFGPLHTDVWPVAIKAEAPDCNFRGGATCFCVLLVVLVVGLFPCVGKMGMFLVQVTPSSVSTKCCSIDLDGAFLSQVEIFLLHCLFFFLTRNDCSTKCPLCVHRAVQLFADWPG